MQINSLINMKKANQELVIILPEGMEDMPVKIIRNEEAEELVVNIINFPETRTDSLTTGKRHTLVWHQNAYERVSLNEIMWIEASGSYCRIHTTGKRTFTLSYPLTRIEERLPKKQFIRIQRSYLVNIDHVKKLIGCSLIVGEYALKIGESYKEQALSEFIFLGVHEQPSMNGGNKGNRKKR